MYYASEDHNKNNRDKHYLNDGDEDFEDDYQDEDQKEMQRRGMSLAKGTDRGEFCASDLTYLLTHSFRLQLLV